MNKNTKKMFVILGLVLTLGLITIIPGFAETQEELAKIFVTREEWKNWIEKSAVASTQYATDKAGYVLIGADGKPLIATNSDGTPKEPSVVGMSEYLNNLEANNLLGIVQGKTKVEMTRRGISETTTAESSSEGS